MQLLPQHYGSFMIQWGAAREAHPSEDWWWWSGAGGGGGGGGGGSRGLVVAGGTGVVGWWWSGCRVSGGCGGGALRPRVVTRQRFQWQAARTIHKVQQLAAPRSGSGLVGRARAGTLNGTVGGKTPAGRPNQERDSCIECTRPE